MEDECIIIQWDALGRLTGSVRRIHSGCLCAGGFRSWSVQEDGSYRTRVIQDKGLEVCCRVSRQIFTRRFKKLDAELQKPWWKPRLFQTGDFSCIFSPLSHPGCGHWLVPPRWRWVFPTSLLAYMSVIHICTQNSAPLICEVVLLYSNWYAMTNSQGSTLTWLR